MPSKSPKSNNSKKPKKAPAKKSASKRPPRKGGGYSLKALIAGLFLLAFLVVSLVLLSQVSRYFHPAAPPVVTNQRPVSMEDLRVEVDSFLLHGDIPLSTVRPLSTGEGRGLEVRAPFPTKERFADLERRLARLDPHIRVARHGESGEVIFRRGEEELYRILFRPMGEPSEDTAATVPPPPTAKSAPPVRRDPVPRPVPLRPDGTRPRVAIIMDDLGRDVATGRKLVSIGLPVTFAILPDQPNSQRLAEFAYQNGREIIIHIPMEPQSYPVTDPGQEALLIELSADEVRRRMRSFITRVPHAVGGNNHMGSRFTEDPEGMRAALEVMRESGLFFVDSLTTGRSVGYNEARQAGIPSAVRDVFLDNVQEEEAIVVQIRKLARLAQERGQAIGICHPYPQTLAALRRTAPELARLGIEVVPVSALLER